MYPSRITLKTKKDIIKRIPFILYIIPDYFLCKINKILKLENNVVNSVNKVILVICKY